MNAALPLLVTIDVECDKDPSWRTRDPLSFRGVLEALPGRLLPLLDRLGIPASFLLSPEVLCDPACMDLFRSLEGHECGTHLHGEYVAPGLADLDFGRLSTTAMQDEYEVGLERAKLATLTALFEQELGRAPKVFRAGRFGIGPATGRILQELGYLVDSSVTPGVRWTRSDGTRAPDFREAGQVPWFVSEHGDLMLGGRSHLCEVPVTILRDEAREPRWFRPWYSDRAELRAIVDCCADAVRREGRRVPLTMMFHNVELVAQASPYPQSEAEVQRYMDDLERTLEHALTRGAEPMTLEQLHGVLWRDRLAAEGFPATRGSAGSDRDRGFATPIADIVEVLEAEGAPAWFAYTVRERAERWDLTEPMAWLADRLPLDAAVLATGCGAGLNLLWLAEQGFTRLDGFDIDPKALAAGRALARRCAAPLRLWQDDGLGPEGLPEGRYDAILALNWTHLVDGFALDSFLARTVARLRPGGRVVLDVIDASFAADPRSRWRTGDWDRPEAERRPSEYRNRHAAAEVRLEAARRGLAVETVFLRPGVIPRRVYVLRLDPDLVEAVEAPAPIPVRTVTRADRPRVLVVVDAPGWAHDHKARALAHHLADDWDLVHRYHAELRPDDLDACDLALFFYWMQLAGRRPLVEAMLRNQDRLLVGICSEVELEGERGAEGIETLARHARAIFVHSERLHRRWAGRFRQTVHLTPNGVDLDRFHPAATTRPSGGPLRVGWAGSLANFGRELRGFDLIREACARLDGVVFDPAIKEERLRDHGEMADWYRSLDVYVCASLSEGTPNPCLEAAACGVPLVTTPVGNMPELVVDGRNGFLVGRSVEAIAGRLALLRDDPALRARMALALIEDIRAWGWDRRAEAYAAMFRAELAARCEGAFSRRPGAADPGDGVPACTNPPASVPSPPPSRRS